MSLQIKTLSLLEASGFLLLANLMMLLGADFPPPVGFLWLMLVSLLLAFGQYHYGNWLFKRLEGFKTLPVTSGFFGLEGLISALIFVALNPVETTYLWLWLAVTILVFTGYGLIFWFVNRLIVTKIN